MYSVKKLNMHIFYMCVICNNYIKSEYINANQITSCMSNITYGYNLNI